MRERIFGWTCLLLALVMAAPAVADEKPKADEEGWISLFDGESLDGWKANENDTSFTIEDGVILVSGDRCHLFYVGDVNDHDFKDFELKLDVKTEPQANSGVYFHTEYQEDGWPAKGYEVQVNNSQSDWRRTGSLYAVKDVRETPVGDKEWFEYHIIVKGKDVELKVNGETINKYTEPENPEHLKDTPGRKIASGTIALQAHDPGSVIRYRNIRIKPLK